MTKWNDTYSQQQFKCGKYAIHKQEMVWKVYRLHEKLLSNRKLCVQCSYKWWKIITQIRNISAQWPNPSWPHIYYKNRNAFNSLIYSKTKHSLLHDSPLTVSLKFRFSLSVIQAQQFLEMKLRIRLTTIQINR